MIADYLFFSPSEYKSPDGAAFTKSRLICSGATKWILLDSSRVSVIYAHNIIVTRDNLMEKKHISRSLYIYERSGYYINA